MYIDNLYNIIFLTNIYTVSKVTNTEYILVGR